MMKAEESIKVMTHIKRRTGASMHADHDHDYDEDGAYLSRSQLPVTQSIATSGCTVSTGKKGRCYEVVKKEVQI